MKSQRVIIIGAGLGGLQCGYILSKNGYDVTVLEQGTQIGGCLQTYKRAGCTFDTGFHYVGGLGEGEVLRWIFDYYGLLDLPWRQLDESCVDLINIGSEQFSLASGYDRFIETLSERFPSQKDGLKQYIAKLKSVGDGIRTAFGTGASMELFGKSAYGFLCDTISDPLLRKVLSGASIRLQYDAATLPLYVYAQINNSFIQSGWRLAGGGMQIAEHLAKDISNFGGKVMKCARVETLEESDGKICAAICQGGKRIEGDLFISDIHPAALLELLKESPSIKNIYRRRITSVRNSYGIFTANIKLKKGVLPYKNSNLYIHSEDADVWNNTGRSTMVSYAVPSDGDFAENIDILTPINWNLISGWESTKPMRRGEEYEGIKKELAQKCIDEVSAVVPGLKSAVDSVFTSTSLTYSNYTSTPQGSAFGMMKDWKSPLTTVLSPRTPIENLLMTGQNLNLHGILGVSMTSLYTCSQILGLETVKKEFKI